MQDVVQGLPVGMGHSWSRGPRWWGAVWEAQEWDGGSLAPDVEVPSKGHMSQGPTPPDGQHQSHHVRAEAWGWLGSRMGDVAGMRMLWELGGQREDGFPGGLTIIRQIQGAHCASIAH